MPRRKQDCPKRMKLEEGAAVGSKESGEEVNEEDNEEQPNNNALKKSSSKGKKRSKAKLGTNGDTTTAASSKTNRNSSSSSGSGSNSATRRTSIRFGLPKNDKTLDDGEDDYVDDEDDDNGGKGSVSAGEDDEDLSDVNDDIDDEGDDNDDDDDADADEEDDDVDDEEDEDTIEEKNECNDISTDEMSEEGVSSGLAKNSRKGKSEEKVCEEKPVDEKVKKNPKEMMAKGLKEESNGGRKDDERRKRRKKKKLMVMRRNETDVDKGLEVDSEKTIKQNLSSSKTAAAAATTATTSSGGTNAETILSSLSALTSSFSSKNFPSSNKLKASSSLLTKCSNKQGARSSPRLPKDAKHHHYHHPQQSHQLQDQKPTEELKVRRKGEEEEEVGAPLDFSIKASSSGTSKSSSKTNGPQVSEIPQTKDDSPLDLSCKRYASPSPGLSASKVPRMDSGSNNSSWNYAMSRALTPPKSRALSSPSSLATASSAWNGNLKTGVNIGSSNSNNNNNKQSSVPGSLSTASMTGRSSGSSSSHGRQNPWQTQWINRSSEQTRDVFTCVWCKESFRSLQEMTEHMKASPRCGMAGMQQAAAAVATVNSTLNINTISSTAPPPPSHHHPPPSASISPNLGNGAATSSASPGTNQGSSSSGREPMSSAVLAKNSMNLPRKLVRGQDVWLGRGAEQTRQILKCMWCGQSFKTLDDMTRHMRVTQHYTNIISQEQIISWKTPEDKLAQAQVNAVLTCKVCDESFGSLKELSYHIVKNAHYKEHIIRSMTEGGHGRRRQTRERRKKSLPVRKLLELERMELTKPSDSPNKEFESTKKSSADGSREFRDKKTPDGHHETPTSETSSSTKTVSMGSAMITCDECNEKLDAKNFIVHIKMCKSLVKTEVGDMRSPSHSSTTGSRPGSGPPASLEHPQASPGAGVSVNDTDDEGRNFGEREVKKEKEDSEKGAEPSSGSVLSAIERLIEKSFDVKSRRNQTTGILQRLGIDEEVCPPWQNMSGSQSSLSHFQSWSSIKDFGGSNKDRRSTSPVPSAASSSFAKENGSISSPSSSCDDSNSSTSLMQHNPNLQLTSIAAAQPTAKLSFPISSIIANSDDSFQKRLRSVSPQSTCSNSSRGTPMTRTTPPPPAATKASSPLQRHNHKGRTVSESSEEGKLKSPVIVSGSERKRAGKSSKSLRKRSRSQSPAPDRESPNSPNTRKSPSNETSETRQQTAASASFHPLMELQKLLDKTDSGSKKQSNNHNNAAAATSKLTATGSSSLLAFNWAFSEATTASTSTTSSAAATTAGTQNQSSNQLQPNCIKCAFCETQFVSKGAYRHHLSKIHFISSNEKESQKETEKSNRTVGQQGQGHGQSQDLSNSNGGHSSTTQGGPESPHSKFLKYTELAKQLSSKYV